ncbi:hypothetical protein SAMN02910451_01305 [Butyrivibrio hungatei]|uniref:Uncharacterized protein n=1 Tax=Butyrivibrio hungatei TaxID=185008 RepID=A0A1G5CZC0_9FIRM|nr:hypothetical protein [Butyrivibrio hungatei]SCY07795.1 hypothetical protein SAMN02910451_01305 [Butyrivibrio hungatei]
MKLKKIIWSMVCLLVLTACGGKKEDAIGNVCSTEDVMDDINSTEDVVSNISSTEEAVSNISSTEDVVSDINCSEDDKRYRAFFEKEFTDMVSDLWRTIYRPSFLFTYADLDYDGSNELIIGNEEGIFFVITEIDGKYNKSGSYGWLKQYGPLPSRYVGNGYFITYYCDNSGMNSELTHYDSAIQNIGITAAFEARKDGWDLYILSKGGTPNIFKVNEYSGDYDEADYTHSFLDYDDAHDCDYDKLKYFDDGYWHGDAYGLIDLNELGRKYTDLVASKESADRLEDLTWRPVGEMIFKDSKIYTTKDISPEMVRLLSDVTTAIYIYHYNERDEIIKLIEQILRNDYANYNGKISYDSVVASDGSSMPCDEFNELVIEALEKR